MAPTATGNASLDQKPADDGGLSPAIWFLVAVVLIFFVLNVILAGSSTTRGDARSGVLRGIRKSAPKHDQATLLDVFSKLM